jgi:hypothetical protein
LRCCNLARSGAIMQVWTKMILWTVLALTGIFAGS